MKTTPALIASLLLGLCSCQTPRQELAPVSQIPPGVAAEGTLANARLTTDATRSLFLNLPIPPQEQSQTKVLKFVIQQPVGDPGKKAWRELWIVMRPAGSSQFIVTFREDGTGSANFEFQSHAGG